MTFSSEYGKRNDNQETNGVYLSLTTELTTVFGTTDYEAIAAATGAYVGNSGNILPSLKINRENETDDGKNVPTGTYVITQDGVAVYGKPALFRVFLNTFQYMQYDEATNTFPNKTVIVKSFNEEMLDEKGGIRCSAISKKELKQLEEKKLISAADLKFQKQIKCYRGLYGLVTMEDAVTANGDKTSIENLPCIWRLAGTNFNAPQEALNSISKLRHIFFQHWLTMDTKRQKQGSNVYYESLVTAILDKEVEFTSTDMETFKSFKEVIDRDNKYVIAKWTAAKRQAEPYDLERDALSELELNDSVNDL